MFAVGTTEKERQSTMNTEKDGNMDGDNSSTGKKSSTGSVPSLKKNYLYNLIYQIVPICCTVNCNTLCVQSIAPRRRGGIQLCLFRNYVLHNGSCFGIRDLCPKRSGKMS